MVNKKQHAIRQQELQEQKAKALATLKVELRRTIEREAAVLSDERVTYSALLGRDGTQRCAGCGAHTKMDHLFYCTPHPLEPCEFYCKECRDELNCVDPFARRNY